MCWAKMELGLTVDHSESWSKKCVLIYMRAGYHQKLGVGKALIWQAGVVGEISYLEESCGTRILETGLGANI